MTEVTEEFLDGQQYTEAAMAAYEAVYGQDFISPGGAPMARELLARLHLTAGDRVLDAGCGPGGSAFLMARESGARVDAIDLSSNMIQAARRRCREQDLEERVTVEHGDCLALTREAHYDAVYSRDVFLHIADKARLFTVLLTALKPGGRLLFTDYCCGVRPWSQDFQHYVARRAYSLYTVDEYGDALQKAGFAEVSGTDLTPRFAAILAAEIEQIEHARLDSAVRAQLAADWRAKLDRVQSGDQRWGLLEARRPATNQNPA